MFSFLDLGQSKQNPSFCELALCDLILSWIWNASNIKLIFASISLRSSGDNVDRLLCCKTSGFLSLDYRKLWLPVYMCIAPKTARPCAAPAFALIIGTANDRLYIVLFSIPQKEGATCTSDLNR